MSSPALVLLALLSGLLAVAIVTDLRSRTIGNGLTLSVAVLAVPWWFACGLSPWSVMMQVAVALIVLLVFAACFAIGMMGGGDVKLLVALALWLPPVLLVSMLIWMAMGGGVLTLIVIADHRLRRRAGAIEIPYGVAIAGAGFAAVANVILTSSVA